MKGVFLILLLEDSEKIYFALKILIYCSIVIVKKFKDVERQTIIFPFI